MRMWSKLMSLTAVMAGVGLLIAVGMARAEDKASSGAQIGKAAPNFTLQDQDGKNVSLDQFKDKVVVLEWVNPACPFVQRHYHEKTMVNLANKYKDQGVVWISINTTHSDTVASNKAWAMANQLDYPVLNDSKGEAARAYGAVTTPDMFIINKDGTLVYKGAIDNDRTGKKGADTINYVDQALSELLAGKTITTPETASYGCGVKYAK